jgi:hypothetical protein
MPTSGTEHQASDPETYSLPSFAKKHQMSLSRLYELLEMGCGPLVTRNGRRRIVTREAATEWRNHWNGKELPSRPKRPNEAH